MGLSKQARDFFASRHTVRFAGDATDGHFICINTVRDGVRANWKPANTDITHVAAIAIDVDYSKDIQREDSYVPGEEELIKYVEDIIEEEKIPHPSVIVHSGYGVHIYYILDKEQPWNSDIENTRSEITISLIEKFHGDAQVKDLSRVLRQLDSLNKKHNNVVTCRVIKDNDIVYDLKDLHKNVLKLSSAKKTVVSMKGADNSAITARDAISSGGTSYLSNSYDSNIELLEDVLTVSPGGIKVQETYGDYPSTTKMTIKCLFHKDNHPSAFLRISEKSGQIVYYKCSSSKCGVELKGLEAHQRVEQKLSIKLPYDKWEKVRDSYRIENSGNMTDVVYIDDTGEVDKNGEKKIKEYRIFSTTLMPAPVIQKNTKKVFLTWDIGSERYVEKLPSSAAGFGESQVSTFVIDKYEQTCRFFVKASLEMSERTGWSQEENKFMSCSKDLLSKQNKKLFNAKCEEQMKSYLETDPRIPAVYAYALASFLPNAQNNIVLFKGDTTSGKTWLMGILENHSSYACLDATSSTTNFVREGISEPYSITMIDEIAKLNSTQANLTQLYYDIFGGKGKGRLTRSGVKRKQAVFSHITLMATAESVPIDGSEGMLNRIAFFDLEGLAQEKKGKDTKVTIATYLKTHKSDVLDMYDNMSMDTANEWIEKANKKVKDMNVDSTRDADYLKHALASLMILSDRFKLSNYEEVVSLIVATTRNRVKESRSRVFERMQDIMCSGRTETTDTRSIGQYEIAYKIKYDRQGMPPIWAFQFKDGDYGFTSGQLNEFFSITSGGNEYVLKEHSTCIELRGKHRIKKITFNREEEEVKTRMVEIKNNDGKTEVVEERLEGSEWRKVT